MELRGFMAVHLLPPRAKQDPFEMVEEQHTPQPAGAEQLLHLPGPLGQSTKTGESPGKGKGAADGKPLTKRQKKSGMCCWFNGTPRGCLYEEGCIFVHRCTNCRTLDSHTTACPYPRKPVGN